jgi:hypothetical protein
MATLEQLHSILARGLPPPREQHVFAAEDGRRARVVRLAGLGTAAFALVWLAALGVAMLGAGRLPGVPLPSVEQVHRVSDAAMRQRSPFVRPRAGRAAARTAAPRLGRSEAQRLIARTDRVQRAAPTPTIPSSPAPADPPPASHLAPLAPAPAPAPAQTPSAPQQGWARRGSTAPPGQAKRDESVPRGHPGHAGTPATPNTIATSPPGATKSPKKG